MVLPLGRQDALAGNGDTSDRRRPAVIVAGLGANAVAAGPTIPLLASAPPVVVPRVVPIEHGLSPS